MKTRRLDELRRRYQLHTYRDVFVEGNTDQRYFQEVAKSLDIRDVVFYCIDSVEIDSDVINGYGLNPKMNRDKVVALLLSLAPPNKFPIGVIDKDFSLWRPDPHRSDNIVYTDFANADMYFVTSENIRKLYTFLKIPISVEATFEILNTLFILRFVASSRNVGLKILDTWTKYVEIEPKDRVLSFDVRKVVRLSNDRKKSLMGTDDILAFFERVTVDHPDLRGRGYFRGHDAYDLLSVLISKYRKQCKMGHDVVRDFLQFSDHTGGAMSDRFLQHVYGIM